MLKKLHYLQQQLELHFLAWKTLKFGFLYFCKSCRELNFLTKKSIPNQLEFWAASYGQNTKQVLKITQIQHYLQFSLKISNGDQHQICSSLSNRLIPSLSFRRKVFWKINWIEKKYILWKISKMLKKRYYFQQQFEMHFWPGKRWNLVFSIS